MTSSRGNSLRRLSGLIGDAAALVRDELNPALAEQQQALIANRLADLQPLAEREQRLAGRLAALEAARIAATAEVCRAHAIDAEQGSAMQLSELLMLLPESAERGELAASADQLLQELAMLAELNANNGHLTRNLLDYTALVIKCLTVGDAQPRYGRDGKVRAGAPERAMLDDRI
jgi:flagellar biosynthesis/type III secretory pathway chaperone